MPENDSIFMSLVIFVPTIFALILLFLPRGAVEWMRWTALIGTEITMALSICMFIAYYQDVIDHNISGSPGSREQTLLGYRAEQAAKLAAEAKPQRSSDWVARYPWIQQGFHIDYYLGVDGISMPLILLTTVL